MRCHKVSKRPLEDGEEEGEGYGAGETGTTITLELKGALSLSGCLLPGCLRGQGACVL